jgi:hypothetical protein
MIFLYAKPTPDLPPLSSDDEWRITRQIIAELRPGWEMEYVDQLSLQEVMDIFGRQDALAKLREKPKHD